MNRSTCDASRRYRSSVVRSLARRVRSFVARAPGARACRRFRDDSPETRSIDRASLARVSRSVDAIAIDDATIHIFHRPFTRSSRASPPPRVARARSNAPARDSASRRDDDRTRPPSLVAPDSAWRASFERVKQNTAIFSRSSFALPRRVARRRVAVDRSIGRIELNRDVVSIHPVRSDS